MPRLPVHCCGILFCGGEVNHWRVDVDPQKNLCVLAITVGWVQDNTLQHAAITTSDTILFACVDIDNMLRSQLRTHCEICMSLKRQQRIPLQSLDCFGAALELGLALVRCLRDGRWRVHGGRWLVPVAIGWLLGRQDGD